MQLNDKHFLIIYQEGRAVKAACVGFRDMNFLHMTGVSSRLSAKQFYSACLDGKLSLNDFEMDVKGKVQQKLTVLPYLADLLYHNCMIGRFVNNGIYIRADYFVGNTRGTFSVGFLAGKTVDFPVTLYREDVRRLSNPKNKVIAIFVKDFHRSIYQQCTYLAKGQELQKLPLPKDVEELICRKNER